MACDAERILKALSTQVISSEFRSAMYPGESFSLEIFLQWIQITHSLTGSLLDYYGYMVGRLCYLVGSKPALVFEWLYPYQEPRWVMINLSAEQRRSFYLPRRKIDESLRDLKNLLGMDKMMCQKSHWMEQVMLLALIAYAIGMVLGGAVRVLLFPALESITCIPVWLCC